MLGEVFKMKKWYKPRGKSMVLMEEDEIEKIIKEQVSQPKKMRMKKKGEE